MPTEQHRKPIKRSPELAPLSRQHHDGLLLVFKIKQGVRKSIETGRISRYVHWYWLEHLAPHFELEESLLTPLLPASNILLQQMQREHALIRKQVSDLKESAEPRQLLDLAKALDDHIRFEERELFPYMEATLSRENLEKTGEALSDTKIATGTWADPFWI
ncbi:MAG: hemerythrin domain-containing protein [Terrimonas sp.]|nr:hemerythrin domain-containing protein [Terrimonas sp.]